MRFDDSLETVLAADVSTAFGAQSAWRQLTDLLGRRRVASPAAVARLRTIRSLVPPPVRAASARGLAFANPPASLVALFAEDSPSVAAPVIAVARLHDDEWLALIPEFSPTARGLLRHRRDLTERVRRALLAFGASDFALPEPNNDVAAASHSSVDIAGIKPDVGEISLADQPVDEQLANDAHAEPTGPFAIAELVARLDAYERDQGDLNRAPSTLAITVPVDHFCFETDAAGMMRWVDGVPREPLIGVILGGAAARTDGVVAGAFRRRAPFTDARLSIPGASVAGGDWQVSAMPGFDAASGRFTGYRGVARRPRADERAEPRRTASAAESLRALMHELRTPTNAISGFAEMIETEMLGPAPAVYRERAGAIRGNSRELIDAIDDVDTAARIEQGALALRPAVVAIAPLMAGIAAQLEPLLRLRGATLDMDGGPDGVQVDADAAAVERIVTRLLSLSVRASVVRERLIADVTTTGNVVAIAIDRPKAMDGQDEAALMGLGATEAEEGGALLGAGFTLRLARNLAAELGGSLTIGAQRLTLRLPAALDHDVGQLSSN